MCQSYLSFIRFQQYFIYLMVIFDLNITVHFEEFIVVGAIKVIITFQQSFANFAIALHLIFLLHGWKQTFCSVITSSVIHYDQKKLRLIIQAIQTKAHFDLSYFPHIQQYFMCFKEDFELEFLIHKYYDSTLMIFTFRRILSIIIPIF